MISLYKALLDLPFVNLDIDCRFSHVSADGKLPENSK